MKIIQTWFRTPWYPIALGAYPVLALLSANAGQIRVLAGMRALVISLALAALLFGICWLTLRRIHRAAFLTSILLVLFFTYGHAYGLLSERYPEAKIDIWLGSTWALIFISFLFWISRSQFQFQNLSPGLNVICLTLLVVSIWQIRSGSTIGDGFMLGTENAPVQNDLVMPVEPPDIYFFLLDSYGRLDGLRDAYDYDNSQFITALEQRGFYVGTCSQSNYVRTDISLTSTLNMMYLQDLNDEFQPDSKARGTLWNSLKHSAVRYNLERLGYKTITFATGFDWLELRDADLFLEPPPFSSGLSEFEGLFLRTTLARYIQDWGWVDPDAVMGDKYRDLFNNIFTHIGGIARMPEATFAYIHVISPHPPFVFDPEGNPTYPPDFWNEVRKYPANLYAVGYQNQLTHLNNKMLEAIDTIFEESEISPIIIIQGDHGPWLQPKNKRMWILNAYYLPGHNEELYPTISPVNSFRLVFDAYFEGNYDLLDDVSFFSPVPNIYDFSEHPNDCEDS